MIVKYSVDKKINLSLKDKIISKEAYKKDIAEVVQCGNENINTKISVIIVAYNEDDDLIRNLDSWKKQTNQNFEIILVDNGLNEKVVEKIKKFDILYIRSNKNLGCCGGRNLGSVYANSDILVFGDADGYNPENYIEQVTEIMGKKDIIAVRGKVKPINSKLQNEFMPLHYDLGDKIIESLINAEGNSVWRTMDYIKAGGFDESLAGGEGAVLQYRMIEFYNYDKKGFVYDPELILYHDYHRDEKKLVYKIRQNVIIQSQLQNKYPFWNDLVKYYADKKDKQIIIRKQPEDAIRLIKEITKKMQEAYKKSITNQKQMRYKNPKLIKERDKYDFSVIIPCYNLGSLLPKAIDSVFAQTLKNIEVIVVDDASTDEETPKVLNKIEKNVKVIRLQKNGGVSVARNEGVKQAKAEYILCLDADDTIEPTYLEKAKNIFDGDEKVGMVGCWAQYFGDSDWIWKPKDKLTDADALIASPVHTATCFRKKLHDSGEGYDSNLRGYEDWDHWLRIIEQDCVVRIIPEALFNYYVRPNSKVKTSNKNSKELVAGIVNNHRKLYEKYVDIVVAQKHYNWAMCNERYKNLEDQLRVGFYRKFRAFINRCLGTITVMKKKVF